MLSSDVRGSLTLTLIQRISFPIDGLNQIGNTQRFEVSEVRGTHVRPVPVNLFSPLIRFRCRPNGKKNQ